MHNTIDAAAKVKSAQGSKPTISATGGMLMNKFKVVAADVAADNDAIHPIDTVPMPK